MGSRSVAIPALLSGGMAAPTRPRHSAPGGHPPLGRILHAVIMMSDLGDHDRDPRDHDHDPGDHDEVIHAITMD